MSNTNLQARVPRTLLQLVPFLVTALAVGWLLANLSQGGAFWAMGWSVALSAVAAPLTGVAARVLLQRNETSWATALVLSVHLLLFLLVVGQLGGRAGYEVVPYVGVGVILFAAAGAGGLALDRARRPLVAPVLWLILGAGTPLSLFALAPEGASTNLEVWVPAWLLAGGVAALCAVQEVERGRVEQQLLALQQREIVQRNGLQAAAGALAAAEEKIDRLQNEVTTLQGDVGEERELRLHFMENVGQELRTPLNAIVNFATIIARGGVGAVNDQQVEYLERIERAGWHLLEILDDILDLARAESGDFRPEQELVNVELVCDEALAGTRGLILGKRVELVRDFPEAIPPVYADPVHLRQILVNLLGNAARHTDEGYVALRVRPREHTVEIVIEDSGMVVHEPLPVTPGTGSWTEARRRAGLELGLPLTRQLVERHGGTVAVHSAPNNGSIFTITLPLPRSMPAYAAPSSQLERV